VRKRAIFRHVTLAVMAAVVALTVGVLEHEGVARAQTPMSILIGQGGDEMTPVMTNLIDADLGTVNSDALSYSNTNVDQAIADFVGTAPGAFEADFVVSERPLTSTETAAATADGRSLAYVPFAATPDALLTLVPNSNYTGGVTIEPNEFCQNIPLTLAQLDGIYGGVSPPYSSWADPRLTSTSSCDADSEPFSRWANLDPTMENEALMSLLDSTSDSQQNFASALAADKANDTSDTSSTTPSEDWPFPQTAVPGGDGNTVGKLVDLNPTSDAPGNVASLIQLGAIMPVAATWLGHPYGVTWNLPAAAVQNGANAFVPPSTAAAAAALADATVAATSDPTTNNLVTFNPSMTDTAAYNNYLMLESYFVVPTSGLAPDKAAALAQLIRFTLGSQGQAIIKSLGAAPDTPAMVSAGLKVIQVLDSEAAADTTTSSTSSSCTGTTTSSSSTTSTSSTSSTTSTTAPCTTATTAASGADSATSGGTTTPSGGTTPSSNTGSTSTTTPSGTGSNDGGDAASLTADGGSSSTGGGTTSSSDSLAFTGDDPVPLAGIGLALFVIGEVALRLLRRKRLRA
jgi:hypothetical protein